VRLTLFIDAHLATDALHAFNPRAIAFTTPIRKMDTAHASAKPLTNALE
jgi:hypothetical protein